VNTKESSYHQGGDCGIRHILRYPDTGTIFRAVMGDFWMNAADVIARSVELGTGSLKCDRPTIHKMLLRVEGGVLQLEQLTIETLKENLALRQRIETCEPSLICRPQTQGAGTSRGDL
jgi:hypothetical protein